MNATPQLHILLLRLYNYCAELLWIPGKQMIFSDHLSRNIEDCNKSDKSTCQGLVLPVPDVYRNASEDCLRTLAMETDRDEQLLILKCIIIKGWSTVLETIVMLFEL